MNEKIRRWQEEYEARREELRQWKLGCKHLVDVMRATEPANPEDMPDWWYLIELFEIDGILSRREYARAWDMLKPEAKIQVLRLDYYAGLIDDYDFEQQKEFYEKQIGSKQPAQKSPIRQAVEKLIAEAEEIAHNARKFGHKDETAEIFKDLA